MIYITFFPNTKIPQSLSFDGGELGVEDYAAWIDREDEAITAEVHAVMACKRIVDECDALQRGLQSLAALMDDLSAQMASSDGAVKTILENRFASITKQRISVEAELEDKLAIIAKEPEVFARLRDLSLDDYTYPVLYAVRYYAHSFVPALIQNTMHDRVDGFDAIMTREQLDQHIATYQDDIEAMRRELDAMPPEPIQ